jgi:hypothetical protein
MTAYVHGIQISPDTHRVSCDCGWKHATGGGATALRDAYANHLAEATLALTGPDRDLAPALNAAQLTRCPRCTGYPVAKRTRDGLPVTTGCEDCHWTGRAHLLTLVVADAADGTDRVALVLKFGPPGSAQTVAATDRPLTKDMADTIVADLTGATFKPGDFRGLIIDDRRTR